MAGRGSGNAGHHFLAPVIVCLHSKWDKPTSAQSKWGVLLSGRMVAEGMWWLLQRPHAFLCPNQGQVCQQGEYDCGQVWDYCLSQPSPPGGHSNITPALDPWGDCGERLTLTTLQPCLHGFRANPELCQDTKSMRALWKNLPLATIWKLFLAHWSQDGVAEVAKKPGWSMWSWCRQKMGYVCRCEAQIVLRTDGPQSFERVLPAPWWTISDMEMRLLKISTVWDRSTGSV